MCYKFRQVIYKSNPYEYSFIIHVPYLCHVKVKIAGKKNELFGDNLLVYITRYTLKKKHEW